MYHIYHNIYVIPMYFFLAHLCIYYIYGYNQFELGLGRFGLQNVL